MKYKWIMQTKMFFLDLSCFIRKVAWECELFKDNCTACRIKEMHIVKQLCFVWIRVVQDSPQPESTHKFCWQLSSTSMHFYNHMLVSLSLSSSSLYVAGFSPSVNLEEVAGCFWGGKPSFPPHVAPTVLPLLLVKYLFMRYWWNRVFIITVVLVLRDRFNLSLRERFILSLCWEEAGAVIVPLHGSGGQFSASWGSCHAVPVSGVLYGSLSRVPHGWK